MKKRKLANFIIVASILAVAVIFIVSLNYTKEEITNFEDCASAGFTVGESYPRQCWANGKHFVEVINWKNDGISLLQNLDTWKYACFGCSVSAKANRCVDPPPRIMKLVNETPDRYCNQEFEVIGGEKYFCSNESRNADFCITLYDPVCGWLNSEEIKCIKFPCADTYSNSCNACKNPDILYFTKGNCPSE